MHIYSKLQDFLIQNPVPLLEEDMSKGYIEKSEDIQKIALPIEIKNLKESFYENRNLEIEYRVIFLINF
jgi:hypothetical protein